ncbi:MAG: hypothetical protein AAGI45_24085 [Cyanobacteria bacterium P01_H01_bin.26]
MFKQRLNRRTLLRLGPVTLASFASATCGQAFSNLSPRGAIGRLNQDPDLTSSACDSGSTLSQTEGPFYTPDSPERQSLLEPHTRGIPIVVTGQVLSSDCVPIANVLLDFWHTNDLGEYDNRGYNLRGHQFTDPEGRYRVETIIPGLYPGRTRHFHVKVKAPHLPVLTTQLYFPGESANQNDFLFNPDLLMSLDAGNNIKRATFNFVLGNRSIESLR